MTNIQKHPEAGVLFKTIERRQVLRDVSAHGENDGDRCISVLIKILPERMFFEENQEVPE
jgi:hypothetical protein